MHRHLTWFAVVIVTSTVSVRLAGADGAQKASAGTDAACAIDTNGGVDCWGHNNVGQVGHEAFGHTVNNYLDPVGVNTFVSPYNQLASGVSAVTSGAAFSCALKSGQVWCWGSNSNGQLGLGTVGGQSYAAQVVPGLTGVTKISAGRSFVCAVKSDGTLWCWGENTYGQLGVSDNTDRHSPTRVIHSVGGDNHWTDIACGSAHCVGIITGLIFSDGTFSGVYTWGHNNKGQLGDTDINPMIVFNDRNYPVLHDGAASPIHQGHPARNPISIAAGYEFTCFWSGETNKIACAGDDDAGMMPGCSNAVCGYVGHGYAQTWFTEYGTGYAGYLSQGPMAQHMCFTPNSSTHPQCIGVNGNGQAGNNAPGPFTGTVWRHDGCTINCYGPVPYQAAWVTPSAFPGTGVHATTDGLAAGATFSNMKISSGTYAGWFTSFGANDQGQLGDATTTERHTPVLVH